MMKQKIYRVGTTNYNCMRVIPSQTVGKNEKVVIGDSNGHITCFKLKKGSLEPAVSFYCTVRCKNLNFDKITFEDQKDIPISSVCLSGIGDGKDRIFAAYGQLVDGFKKKVSVFDFLPDSFVLQNLGE